MGDWVDDMSADERESWDEFVRHTRADAMQKIDESAFVLQLVPKGEPDIKFCVELGLAIMFDKPILAVIAPDGNPPGKLLLVCDAVVKADIDTEEGREIVARTLQEIHDVIP